MEKDEGYAEKTGWPYVLENAAYNFTGYVKFRSVRSFSTT